MQKYFARETFTFSKESFPSLDFYILQAATARVAACKSLKNNYDFLALISSATAAGTAS